MNERYKFWQGWTLALRIMNILALNVLKISGSFWKSGKNALRIYPPPKKKRAERFATSLVALWLKFLLSY